jgi:hypothetical protein
MNVTTTPPRIANDGTDGIVEDVDARAITAPRPEYPAYGTDQQKGLCGVTSLRDEIWGDS